MITVCMHTTARGVGVFSPRRTRGASKRLLSQKIATRKFCSVLLAFWAGL